MEEISLESLHSLCTDETITLTQHLQLRMRERGIKYADIKNAIMTGKIIEQYPTDQPFPSCLIFGLSVQSKPLHVVCGIGEGLLWIITTYYPDSNKWEPDFETRRGKA